MKILRSALARPFLSRLMLAWLVPLCVLALWELASMRGWMSAQTLPSPAAVWQMARELWATDLLANLWISLQRVIYGLIAGVAGGVLLGVWLGFSRSARDFVLPTFFALAQIPTLAWIPFFMLLFGLGELLKFAVIFKAVLVPITIHTIAGVIDTPLKLREAAQALCLPRRQVLLRLILPAALPSFSTGLRLALAQGWVSLLAVELLASSEGIGYLMVSGRQLMMLDMVFVCIVVIAMIGIVMDLGIQWLDARIVRWPRPALSEFAPTQQTHWSRAWAIPFGIVLLWTVVSHFSWIDARILASPKVVGSTLFDDTVSGELPIALAYSFTRAMAGLALGGLIGIVAGIGLGLSPLLDRLFAPSLSSLRQVAIFAWVPLLTAWFGLGDFGKIIFISLAVFFPLFVATHRATQNISTTLRDVAQVWRLSLWQRTRLLLLPSATSAIFAGLRTGFIYAWLGAIGAEYFMRSDVGIGNYMMMAQQQFDMAKVLAGMLLVGLMGSVFNVIGQRLENASSRWRVAGQATQSI